MGVLPCYLELAMLAAIRRFFAFLESMFAAAEATANSALNCAKVMEDHSAAWRQECSLEHEQRLAALMNTKPTAVKALK
jgi:hypothetical protein